MTENLLKQATVLLDRPGSDWSTILPEVVRSLCGEGRLDESQGEQARQYLQDHPPKIQDLGRAVGVVRIPLADEGAVACAMVGLHDELLAINGATVKFCWVVIGDTDDDRLSDEALEPFGWMLIDDHFQAEIISHKRDDIDHGLLAVYRRYLHHLHEPPEPPLEIGAELQRTGRLFGGVMNDIGRRLPHYRSDFTDGLSGKSMASILFLFFACLAPAIAFGGLLSVLTEGSIGAMEMILATTICGTIYALTSGQPLTILGSTGPVIIFMGILYALCRDMALPFFATLFWVGAWTMVILVVLAITDACSLIRYFTRFTDEIFAALISLIFIVEAIKDTLRGFFSEGPVDAALASVILALGTYQIAMLLSRARRSAYLLRTAREFLADFGPAIAILTMTVVALSLDGVAFETLAVPTEIGTTTGRPWLVDPTEAPVWVWGAAIVPALLVSMLLFLDQNITVRLVNSPAYRLRKGSGYHLDLLVVGLLVGVCSLFGLPWMVAATVRSLNHVRSLADIDDNGDGERILGVAENRVTPLAVHLLVGASLLLLSLLEQVPMSVLFGLFLFMGVASMNNNQFFDRARLWLMDPARYPPTHYLRRVPRRAIHGFTGIQAVLLALLWVIKTSFLGILFPLFIALLVPIRLLLGRWFAKRDLAFLDGDEEPADEEYRSLD